MNRFFKRIIRFFMGTYPLPAYHFKIEWGGARISCLEITGLSMEYSVIEYREGGSPQPHTVKMPGLQKSGNIVLKRGIMKGDNEFFEWFRTVLGNAAARRDIVISLLDEVHQPVMIWKARSAWPVKYSGPDLKAGSNEVAMETLELTHEGITVETT